jgi:predicted patatin/cPLA2 family phospholipase
MSLYLKDGYEYADGGFGNLIPVQEAITKGATFIDTIVLRQEKAVYTNPSLQNAVVVFARTFDFMLNQIANDDLIISQLQADSNNAQIHFYFVNRILTSHSFIFDKKEMTKWWQEGIELYQSTAHRTHILEAKKK